MTNDHIPLARLLSANHQWCVDVEAAEPGFFKQLASGQKPSVLWIGCADSRVPETVLTGARPGEIFVHRNIANQFHADDESAIAVLTYAVDHLGVEHVVVVGHTECGGAAACFGAATSDGFKPGTTHVVDPGLPAQAELNRWLAPLTELAASSGISQLPRAEALPKLVEANVRAQVDKIGQNSIIQKAWANKSRAGKDVYVHGWVFDIGEGKLRDLGCTLGPGKA